MLLTLARINWFFSKDCYCRLNMLQQIEIFYRTLSYLIIDENDLKNIEICLAVSKLFIIEEEAAVFNLQRISAHKINIILSSRNRSIRNLADCESLYIKNV